MAIIATLAVSITAKTKKFVAGLGKARKSLKNFGRSIGRVSKSIFRFGTVATAAAVAGLVIFINKSLKAVDEAGKLSDILNIATEDLLAFRLQAELAGGSTAGFDKLLGIFVRRLGEAKEGTGEAANTLERLGLNIDDLVNLDTAEALGVVTDAINKLGTAADINAARYQIFGRQGITAGNQLAQGSEGLRKARIQADKLGITISRVDAAQIEEANDSFTRLNFLIQGVFTQLSKQLAPFITVVNDKLVEMGTSGEGMGVKIVNAFESIALASIKVVNFMQALLGVVQGLVGAFLAVATAISALLTGPFSELTVRLAIGTGKTFKDAFDNLEASANRTEASLKLTFDNIRFNAKKAAKEALKNRLKIEKLDKSTTGGPKAKLSTRQTFARQINLARVAITGLGGTKRKQQVNDSQIQETNRILGNILNNLGGTVAVTA